MSYLLHIIIMINIYIILSVSANLLVGVSNLLSIGQAAFYGLGAYLTVYALMILHLPLIPVLVFVFLITGIFSFVISLPTLRLRGDYFILGTLGFQLIVYTILYNWVDVTRGPYGIPGIPSPKLLGIFPIEGIYSYVILSSVLSIITILVFYKLLNSPFGRNLKGIREDEASVIVLGKNVVQLKVWAFFISAAFSGIAGFLYATYVSYIDPTSFNLDEAIFILTAVLIGGSGNTRGPVIGAVFVVILPELLRFVGLPDSIAANMRQIIFGLLLIWLMRYRPFGLWGERKMV